MSRIHPTRGGLEQQHRDISSEPRKQDKSVTIQVLRVAEEGTVSNEMQKYDAIPPCTDEEVEDIFSSRNAHIQTMHDMRKARIRAARENILSQQAPANDDLTMAIATPERSPPPRPTRSLGSLRSNRLPGNARIETRATVGGC